ncbi:MAG: intradiol ring-cleavage dioxygenase [Vicinamibacterales bacterium]
MSAHFRRRLNRREALGLLGAASAAVSAACSGDTPTSPSATTTSTTTTTTTTTGTTTTAEACAVSPTETLGPYPSLGDYVRSNITDGKPGTPLRLTLTVVNASSGCAPVSGANVEIWQCDHAGVYSEYGTGRGQTFLRGLQVSDAQGQVTFDTIYPGWYQGRATHIHVEVSMGGRSIKVTQIAFPEDISAQVYSTGVYASHGLNSTSNARDGIFADSLSQEMITISGSPASGYTGTFTVGVSF